MKSVIQAILKRIEEADYNQIFFIEDFRQMGSAEAVKSAVHRLCRKKIIRRIGRGIYAKPSYFELIGHETTPGLEEIAKAIAKRDRTRIIPTGSFALNALGLSTQVPLRLVYLTDGSAREIKIGRRTIKFKRTSPRNLSYQSELITLVVQGLKEIGSKQITEKEINHVVDLLKKEEYDKLKHDIMIAPQWIAEIIAKSLEG